MRGFWSAQRVSTVLAGHPSRRCWLVAPLVSTVFAGRPRDGARLPAPATVLAGRPSRRCSPSALAFTVSSVRGFWSALSVAGPSAVPPEGAGMSPVAVRLEDPRLSRSLRTAALSLSG